MVSLIQLLKHQKVGHSKTTFGCTLGTYHGKIKETSSCLLMHKIVFICRMAIASAKRRSRDDCVVKTTLNTVFMST